jgi:16S rRNA G1207 methylase RsmC
MTDPNLEKFKQDIVFEEHLRGHRLVFHTTWGLFSPRGVDAGSRLLIDYLEVEEEATCLDLGCGYGPLGLTLARLAPRGEIHLVDKDFIAVEYAAKNARLNQLPHCRVYLSNGFSHVPAVPFDLIVSNLPAKVGSELLYILLAEARERLVPGGRLYVVTIAGLKEYIRRTLRQLFGNYTKVKQGRTHAAAVAIRE